MSLQDKAIKHKTVRTLLYEASKRFIMPRFQSLKANEVHTKTSPSDLVTIADIETELWLSDQLQKLLPGSLVVGEEAVSKDPTVINALQKDKPVWIIDPVDGTSNFARGSDKFCVMLALVQKGESLASWIYAPRFGKLYQAQKDTGAFEIDDNTGIKYKLSIDPKRCDQGFISVKYFPTNKHDLIRKAYQENFGPTNTIGCAGLEYAYLASNRSSHSVYRRLKPWDHVPGTLLASEAGASIVRFNGEPYSSLHNSGGIVASNSHERGVSIIKHLNLTQF